jgi:hypothetical protein
VSIEGVFNLDPLFAPTRQWLVTVEANGVPKADSYDTRVVVMRSQNVPLGSFAMRKDAPSTGDGGVPCPARHRS